MKLFGFAFLSSAALLGATAQADDIPTTTLATGKKFPLIGLGVGNLPHDIIPDMVAEAMKDDKKIVMFDTAHASKNEKLVVDGVVKGVKGSKQKEAHIITKVWYTHLGYERTKLSVQESLKALKNPNAKVHVLLHWPRCKDDIPWMNCEEEEAALPDAVKKLGPAPHLHKDTAFVDSWKALEDIFLGKVNLGKGLPKVESIGVSNFDVDDLKKIAETSRVTPHIIQDNVWSYAYHPFLMDYIKEHKIHLQVYNVMNGIFSRAFDDVPEAYGALLEVTGALTEITEVTYSIVQTVFKYFAQNNVSVIPRTTNVEHLQQNSAVDIAKMPDLTTGQQVTVRNAIAALLKGEDMSRPIAHIHNTLGEGKVHLYWVNEETGEEVAIKENLEPGEHFSTVTSSGHKFVAYAAEDKSQRKEIVIDIGYGEQQSYHVDEF